MAHAVSEESSAHLNKIHLLELLKVRIAYEFEYGDDVFMTEMPQQLDLAESSETEHGVIEGTDFLDRYASFGGYVCRGAYYSVCTFAYSSAQRQVDGGGMVGHEPITSMIS
jgi:hypothetical protein